MNDAPAALALGTVQFGLAYGVSGQAEPVPEHDVRAILERAAMLGICRLDTAPAYGDIEERLAGIIGDLPFEVVSKFPPHRAFSDERDAREFVDHAFHQSYARLGGLLCGMLFHRGEDLIGPFGRAIWETAMAAASPLGVSVGVSCYDPTMAAAILNEYPIGMVQIPGNALDQRHTDHPTGLGDAEVSLRSLFLQGLLLMPEAVAAQRVPAAVAALTKWHHWCRDQQLSPLRAALGIAKGLPSIRFCLVGVENVDQLDEIAESWAGTEPITDRAIATSDLDVIDPRLWAKAA